MVKCYDIVQISKGNKKKSEIGLKYPYTPRINKIKCWWYIGGRLGIYKSAERN